MQKFRTRFTGIAVATLTLLLAAPTQADLLSVDWAVDGIPDGFAAGQIGGAIISLTSADGNTNGGSTFSGWDWAAISGSDDVAGIGDAGVNDEGISIDWNDQSSGFVNMVFDGVTITDPILSFNFLDSAIETFDFDDALTLTILDQAFDGSVTIAANNVVTTDGSYGDGVNDGFTVQVSGTFGALGFLTNVNSLSEQSVGFTLFADSNSIVSVPEPTTTAAILIGLGLVCFRRRR